MPTINIPVSGRITPYTEGYRVIISLGTGIRPEVINVGPRGIFSKDIECEIPVRTHRQIVKQGYITGDLVVINAENNEVYAERDKRFLLQDNPSINIRIPASNTVVPINVRINGRVIQKSTSRPLEGCTVKFTTRIGNQDVSLSGNSELSGRYQLSSQYNIKEDILPQEIRANITVMYGGAEINDINPKEAIFRPGEQQDIEITVGTAKAGNLIVHFREDETRQPFGDPVALEIILGTRTYSFTGVIGEVTATVEITGWSEQATFRAGVIDVLGRITRVSETTAILRTFIINEHTIDLWYPKNEIKLSLLRPWDMLLLDFDFSYLLKDQGELKPAYKAKEGLMVVTFPPQSFAEEAVFESDPKTPITNEDDPDYDEKCDPASPKYEKDFIIKEKTNIPASSRISGKSRLTFLVKSGQKIILSEVGLLKAMSELELNINWVASETTIPPLMEIAPGKEIPDWLKRSDLRYKLFTGFEPVIPPGQILPPSADEPWIAPRPKETSIEAPFRLQISPHKDSQWMHDASAKAPSARKPTELWHSRLVYRKNPENKTYNTIRAIWALDPLFKPDNIKDPNTQAQHYSSVGGKGEANPFRMSLDAFDRENIVHLTSNRKLKTSPVNVENLMLSSLGALMDVHGQWEPPDHISLKEWQHRATLGRDQFVKVVYKGYLFPFGNQAALVKVTERKIIDKVSELIEHSAAGFAFLQVNITQADYIGLASQALITAGPGSFETKDKFREQFKKQVSVFAETRLKGQNSRLTGVIKKDLESRFEKLIQEVTDTKSLLNPENSITYLKQRMFIIVSEPEKIYNVNDASVEKRKWPFVCVRFKTLITSNLENPDNSSFDKSNSPGKYGQSLFWPMVNGQLFLFKMSAEDYNGNISEFMAPLIFAENIVAKDTEALKIAKKSYDTPGKAIGFSGQSVLFADGGDNPGKTTLHTNSITFSAFVHANYGNEDNPAFFPHIRNAEVCLPAIQALLGNSSSAIIEYWGSCDDKSGYIKNGFDANANVGEIYAKVTNDLIIDYNAHGDKVGGLVKPNIKVTGLSRLLGPVGGELTDLAQGIFKPESLFDGSDATIFGTIQLWDILKSPVQFTKNSIDGLPVLISKSINGGSSVDFNWKELQLVRDSGEYFIPENKNIPAQMKIEAGITTGTNRSETRFYSQISNFTISLLGTNRFIEINFGSIEFESKNGDKDKVSVVLGNIEFYGPLKFVSTLINYIPLAGFNDKPDIVVSENGIRSGFALSIPSIAIGVFTLENISLGAAFTIPYVKDPLSVRFNFCDRQNPFSLTVSLIGGGGFFGITINPSGVQMLEAAFEFGASLSLNFGVASGKVTIVAGIYFKMELLPVKRAELTGYLKIHGAVSVLGLITASITLLLELRYFPIGKCSGRATLTIEVSIIFFSIKVEISYEKTFIGLENDPTFLDMMGSYNDPETGQLVDPWTQYWSAFAK
ncbi:MAG: hypothetical protein AB9834_20545 [Lentimicrobium sp.]